jgi:hypothetical protein
VFKPVILSNAALDSEIPTREVRIIAKESVAALVSVTMPAASQPPEELSVALPVSVRSELYTLLEAL